jgi:hypothetical protein
MDNQIELSLNLKQYEKEHLGLLDWLILTLIHYEKDEFLLKTAEKEDAIKEQLIYLERQGYIKLFDYELYNKIAELRDKGRALFFKEDSFNFDDFFDVFPSFTVDGRPLRVASKFYGNNITEGYKRAKKIYLQKVKTTQEHQLAVKVVKARALSEDTKYMQNIETYIRQKTWEVDSSKYLGQAPDWDRNTV